jgi:hypothetical protein
MREKVATLDRVWPKAPTSLQNLNPPLLTFGKVTLDVDYF